MNGTFPTPGSYGVSMQPSTITCVSNAGSNVSNYSIMMMNAMSQQALASNNDPQTFQHQQGQDLSSSENTALVMQNNVANSNNAAPSNSRTDRNQEHNGGWFFTRIPKYFLTLQWSRRQFPWLSQSFSALFCLNHGGTTSNLWGSAIRIIIDSYMLSPNSISYQVQAGLRAFFWHTFSWLKEGRQRASRAT